MYHKGKNVNKVEKKPFLVECTNCGSHDVAVYAHDYNDLMIRCCKCGSYLNVGMYNEVDYGRGY